jgi:HEAT repeat protein
MRSAVANGVSGAAHLWSTSGARRLRIWCILFFSAGGLFVSCAPTMKDLPKLQQTMQSPDESARVSAVKDLGRMRDADPGAVVPLLTDSLGKDSSASVRAEAARSLKHYPGEQAATALGQALKSDTSPTVRAAAADAVGTLNREDAFELLKTAATTDGDTSVREAAVTAMGNVSSSQVLPFLCNAVGTQALRDAAITALAQNEAASSSPEVITALLAVVNPQNTNPKIYEIFARSNDPRVRQYLYAAILDDNVSRDTIDVIVDRMVQSGDTSFVPQLTQRLQSETNLDTQVRICQALGRFRDPYPVPTLIMLAQQNQARNPAFLPHLIGALDGIGDARARDPLCSLMCQAGDKQVRNDAQEALFHHSEWFGKGQDCGCKGA